MIKTIPGREFDRDFTEKLPGTRPGIDREI